ncbi:MAG: D-alanyl-D-alanine carboxypeptidase [Thermodesulfovibrionales bacterium]|nr:D-alanyl-D-alanine carboxypeptidase [Thermodesulfovibrionales bacterium]
MKTEFRAKSLALKVKKKNFLILFFSLLFFNFQLSTCLADETSSKAVVVMEASTGRVLFAKNPNLKLPPASTTKLVTAMVVLDRAKMSNTDNQRGGGKCPLA